MDQGRQGKIYLIYILLIIFAIFGYGIRKICCFTLFPDEFGYWASAARWAGYDWSDMAGLGSYYSFGYGMLLFPLMKLIPDGILLYRAAVGLNVFLVCVSVFLMQGIVRELFPQKDPVGRVFVSGIAALYPAWIVYMQTTMAEALLMFLFVLITRLLTGLMRKPGALRAAGLAFALVYLYCVHMRTLGVVIACAAVIAIWGAGDRIVKKTVIVFFLTLLAAGALSFCMKRFVIAEVFGQAKESVLSTNDYGGLWVKVREVFTLPGVIHFAMGIVGKVFYLGLAGFGLFYPAMGWCVGRLRKREGEPQSGIALFLLLSVVFEILICTVYMIKKENVDSLIYGRYNDFLMPVLIAVGACALTGSRHPFRISALSSAASAVMAFALALLVEKEGREGIREYMVVGICYLLRRDSFEPYLYFASTLLLGAGMIFFAAFILRLSCRREGWGWMLGFVLLMEVALGLRASHQIPYHYNKTHFIDQVIAQTIEDEMSGDRAVIYLKEDRTKYIDAIQMMLGSRPIKAVEPEAFFDQDLEGNESGKTTAGDFVITVSWTEYGARLEKMFDRHVEANSFHLYYNQE